MKKEKKAIPIQFFFVIFVYSCEERNHFSTWFIWLLFFSYTQMWLSTFFFLFLFIWCGFILYLLYSFFLLSIYQVYIKYLFRDFVNLIGKDSVFTKENPSLCRFSSVKLLWHNFFSFQPRDFSILFSNILMFCGA
jgi:hypothetical protein